MQSRVIDFHTHAFSDDLAPKAMEALGHTDGMVPSHGATINELLYSMDEAGIGKSVICSIATRPEQFDPILQWSKKIRQERIIPLLSIHPLDENLIEKVKIVAEEGFVGIKLHPYYQNFSLDDESIYPLYEELSKHGLILESHTGYDAAYPNREKLATPEIIAKISTEFPELKFVATHFGGWDDWDDVEKFVIGKQIYFEISFGLQMLELKQLERMLLNHPEDKILFGTDSPWTDQKESMELFSKLNIPTSLKENILYENAEKLLG